MTRKVIKFFTIEYENGLHNRKKGSEKNQGLFCGDFN